MLNDILNIANRYARGLEHVQNRKAQWLSKHIELKGHLKKIADDLNANALYKQGFFVDTLHAFNEEINGICTDMPSLTLRSGDMSLLVTFTNEKGDCKEYMEHGFQITFNPIITGEVLIFLQPHYSDMNKTKPELISLAIINEPGQMTMDIIDAIISKGMEMAFYSSFTGVAEQNDDEPNPADPPHHNPIGFKRYETTETGK